MKKPIFELQKAKIKKEDMIKLQEQILADSDYFKMHDINSLSKRGSNLLHFMVSFNLTDCIDILLNEKIDVFKKNKSGMYPVSYAKNMQVVQSLFNHSSIKNNVENKDKLHKLLFIDLISPVYFFKPNDFRKFLDTNKHMLSTLNDDNISFLLNIHQVLTIKSQQQYELFKQENNISFSNEQIYLYILDKVKNNKNINYNILPWTTTEQLKLAQFSDFKEQLYNSLIKTVTTGKEQEKISRLSLGNYSDFYLYMSYEYEQADFLEQEYKKISNSLKKGKINYINDYEFMDDLLYAWKDYINQENITQQQLQKLCEDNNLYGLNVSPVFSINFIEKLIEMFKKETLKVFPIKDGKLFAKNTYLKIQSNYGQSSGYLRFALDKNIINIDVSDYSPNREDVFPDDIESLKRSFVHEYTHLLQVVSEHAFRLDFTTNEDWLKIQNILLESTTNKDNLSDKLIQVTLEEFSRNFLNFSDENLLIEHLQSINNITDVKQLQGITKKIMLLIHEDLRITEFKKYIHNNVKFMYVCLHENNSNLQKLYLEKLNRDEKLKNYYNNPVEIHARLNEHLLKLKNVDLLRDFNFLSEEDNLSQKKQVLKDLKKFNKLITQQFEKIKEKNKPKLTMF